MKANRLDTWASCWFTREGKQCWKGAVEKNVQFVCKFIQKTERGNPI